MKTQDKNEDIKTLLDTVAWAFNSYHALYPLLITFANSLDPNQAWQNVQTDQELNCWHFWKNV